MNGRRKAAVLLVSLGSRGAAEVFRHLPNEMIEQLTVEMARTPTVDPEHASMVMEEMVALANARGYIAEGGLRFAREVLEQSVGAARAGEILNRLSVIIETTPFEFLRNTPPDQIAAFLRNEHPQTVAMVVAQLPNTTLAAKVMELLAPELQADVAVRIATMGQTSPDVVKEVARVMERKLETVLQREFAAAGGVRSLAAILNAANRTTERNIMAGTTNQPEQNPGDYDTPEQQIGAFNNQRPWESCMTICQQWAWKPNDKMKSLKECIQTLVQCAGGMGTVAQ